MRLRAWRRGVTRAQVCQHFRIIISFSPISLPPLNRRRRAVTVEVNARDVTVKGPRGTLTKSFKHSRVEIQVAKTAKGSIINVEMWFGNRKERARTRTISSHIANMIKGVTKGFEYKMRMVYAHFPINVNLEDNNRTVAIRNFLGEKKVMKVGLLDGTVALYFNCIRAVVGCYWWQSRVVGSVADRSRRMTAIIGDEQCNLGNSSRGERFWCGSGGNA